MYKLFLILVLFIISTNQQASDWKEARPGEFPFMVWLANKVIADINNKELATCVGSLISPEWAIIDGVCSTTFSQSDIVIPVESGVVPDKEQGISVAQMIVHEDYKRYTSPSGRAKLALANSIALLKLSKPVDMLQGFAPIKLPSGPVKGEITVVKPTWKRDASVVMYHETKLYEWSTCQSKYTSHDNFYYTSAKGMVCSAERQFETPTLGPFVAKGSSPAEATLIGVLTKADKIGGNGVYIATDIGQYREWIKQKTGI